jgi:hypothetical protein
MEHVNNYFLVLLIYLPVVSEDGILKWCFARICRIIYIIGKITNLTEKSEGMRVSKNNTIPYSYGYISAKSKWNWQHFVIVRNVYFHTGPPEVNSF